MSAKKILKKSLLSRLINAAKACIPACWKQKEPPTTAQWRERVLEIQLMVSMTQNMRYDPPTHGTVWAPWLLYESDSSSAWGVSEGAVST